MADNKINPNLAVNVDFDLLPEHKPLNNNQIELRNRGIQYSEYLALCRLYFGYEGYKDSPDMKVSILIDLEDDKWIIQKSKSSKLPDVGSCSEADKFICFKVLFYEKSQTCMAITSKSIEEAVDRVFESGDRSSLMLWVNSPHVAVQQKQ